MAGKILRQPLPKTLAGWTISAISLLVVLLVALLLLTPRQTLPIQIDVSVLPVLNAGLNATSATFLMAGYGFIRRRRVGPHRFCMIAAVSLSALFLVSYVFYHAIAGSTHFASQGWIRPIYFTILISHIALAVLVLPLAMTTLYCAWRNSFAQHRRIARWTLPVWLYVSISGVLVYLMLYHWS